MSSAKKRVVYQEFGEVDTEDNPENTSLPPNQQNLRIQTTKAGRKGKIVTVITGFVTSPENINQILKQLHYNTEQHYFNLSKISPISL